MNLLFMPPPLQGAYDVPVSSPGCFMPRLKTLLILIALCPLAAHANGEPPVEVMVLGTYHFESPGLDTHNIKTESVLGARRQSELHAIATAIVSFKPTRVMVEMVSSEPRRTIKAFAEFDDNTLRRDANEIVQLGFRIARMSGLSDVHGIDVQPSPGAEDFYPYAPVVDLARSLGRQRQLEDANQPVAELSKAFEERQATDTLAELLILGNAPQTARLVHQPLFEYLSISAGDAQPAADLSARWYLRNARIFGNLLQIGRPGDRVVVVYGFGHNHWLRHFVQGKQGYQLVDPIPYLEQAQRIIRGATP